MRATLRISILTALFFTASTSIVMASSTACRIALRDQFREAQGAVHQRVHHSANTLARWKIGAAAWSKAHGGKVYAGVPAAPRRQDWTPLRFSCNDAAVALDLSRPDEGLLLAGEAAPEFTGYGGFGSTEVASAIDAAKMPQAEEIWEQAAAGTVPSSSFGGGAGANAGSAPNGPVGPASFPPGPVPSPLAGPVPAPESPTIVLLGTGMLSFLVSKLRRRTVV